MKHLILTIAMSLTFSMASFAQNIEDEVGFLYTKAKYLLKTERIEDAVKELNKVIKKKADFEDALLLRAEAKYVLGAYGGVKKDLNEYISKNGITARVARLYGLADFQGGNKKAAFNSISLALNEIKDDAKLYEIRAGIYEKRNEMAAACQDYKMASKLGSGISKRKYKNICGGVSTKPPVKTFPKEPTSEKDPKKGRGKPEIETEDPNDGPTNMPGETPAGDVDIDRSPVPDRDKDEETIEEEDDAVNEIVVDQDLTLLIQGDGLGSRDVMRQPNILIISDDSGDVSIDVCVSEGGRITSAVFDNANSTIKKQSLVSLAIRKAKEFWFERKSGDERCGKIVFRIKGA